MPASEIVENRLILIGVLAFAMPACAAKTNPTLPRLSHVVTGLVNHGLPEGAYLGLICRW